MTVSAHLEAARLAHRQYRQIHAQSKGANLAGMGQAVHEALSHRAEAEACDPQFTDQAWALDAIDMKASHEALCAFYVRFLAPPAVYVQDVA